MTVAFQAYQQMGICQEFLQTVKPILISASTLMRIEDSLAY